MNLKIKSFKKDWNVFVTPSLRKIKFDIAKTFIAEYNLEITFESNHYNLPYQVIFKDKYVSVVNDDLEIIDAKPVIFKERKPLFTVHKLIKEHFSDKNFHVVLQVILLLSVLKEADCEAEILEKYPLHTIDTNDFYLKKDGINISNKIIQYSISEKALTEDFINFPRLYFPKNCSVYRDKSIYTGSIDQCEEILYNKEKLNSLRHSVFERQKKQDKIDADAFNFHYFHRGGWENDYKQAMGETNY